MYLFSGTLKYWYTLPFKKPTSKVCSCGSYPTSLRLDEETGDLSIISPHQNNKIIGISKKGIFRNIKITDMGLNVLNLLENDELFVLFAEFQKVK